MTARLLSLLVPALLLLPLAAPTAAVGAQGVDLSPLLPREGGTLTATLDGDQPIELRVSNTAEEPRDVRVYAAEATMPEGGGIGVGGPAEWLQLDRAEPLTLAPGERIDLTATVDLGRYRQSRPERVLFLVEVDGGGTVVPRAATIVAVRDSGAAAAADRRGLILVAAWLLIMVSAGLTATGVRQRRCGRASRQATLAPVR